AVAAVDEVDVLPAIAVEISNTDARAKFFEVDGDAVVAFEMREVDAGFFRDVPEADGARGSGLGGRRKGDQEKNQGRKKNTRSQRASAYGIHEGPPRVGRIVTEVSEEVRFNAEAYR